MLIMVNEISGWWFQTWLLWIPCYIYKGYHPNPIDELHHFSRWLLHHQPEKDVGIGQTPIALVDIKMGVHCPKKGIYRYWSVAMWKTTGFSMTMICKWWLFFPSLLVYRRVMTIRRCKLWSFTKQGNCYVNVNRFFATIDECKLFGNLFSMRHIIYIYCLVVSLW